MDYSIVIFLESIMESNNFVRICLVHYHEIGLKGRNRSYFENLLCKNLESVLKFNKISFSKIKKISGRVCIIFDSEFNKNETEYVLSCIKRVPGIARVSIGYKCEQSIEGLTKSAILVMEESVANSDNINSFKVSARRNHTNFEYDSMEINKIVGGNVADAFPNIKVQMKDPSIDVRLEVIEGSAYVYGKSIVGVGGLPIGSSGRVIGLLSSGIDSPVALWKVARRGANVIGIHFSGAPVVSSESEYLVKEIGEVFQKSGLLSRIYIVRIGKYQKQIALDCPEKLRIVLYRRFMYKIAQELALRLDAKALVTGESLGQVASQTIENLSCTDNAVDLPVFRPLIGSDKQEIIDRAISIGTFDISSQQAPDCCTLYMPKIPETHAKIKYIELAEKDLEFEKWTNEALDNAQILDFHI